MRQINPSSGGDGSVVVPFAFGDASPHIITSIKTGNIVKDAELVIEAAFDDASATLALGTAASPAALLPASKVDPTVECTFATDENYIAPVDETVILTITPGISTSGSGYVLLHVRRV
jgi:hypothetical protein